MGTGHELPDAQGQAPEPSTTPPPRSSRRARRPRSRTLLGWVAGLITLALVAGALTAYAQFRSLFGFDQVNVTGLGHRPPQYTNALNILLIGSDSRTGNNRKFGARIAGQRSDTIMVLHLSPGRRHVLVLSIPRDSVVPVLSCPAVPAQNGQAALPGQIAQSGVIEQINATFAVGGPGCLWKTIEQTTGIRLDHFMELNFTGFEKVINDLGGVSICLPYAINDPHSKLHLSAGRHHVLGAEALAYWRVRYIGAGSDLERITRDQFLMASLVQGARRANLLGDPARLYSVVRDITGSLTTDSQLSQSMLISLADSVRSLPPGAVRFIQVPVVAYQPNPNWVAWAPDAAILFRAIAHDRKLPRTHSRQHGGHARPHPAGTQHPAGQPASSATPSQSVPSAQAGANGGFSASTNVCADSGAFAGPLGG